jgi:hypothetical protein
VRYPFAPVDAHKLGVSPDTLRKWRERGMDETNADRIATALGLHPWQLWPEMLAVATAPVMSECAHPDCLVEFVLTRSDKRFCSARCRNRNPERMARQRERAAAYARNRYATDSEYRAAQLAYRRAYAESARGALNAKQRAYYQRTAEQQRAARRDRYWAQKTEAA